MAAIDDLTARNIRLLYAVATTLRAIILPTTGEQRHASDYIALVTDDHQIRYARVERVTFSCDREIDEAISMILRIMRDERARTLAYVSPRDAAPCEIVLLDMMGREAGANEPKVQYASARFGAAGIEGLAISTEQAPFMRLTPFIRLLATMLARLEDRHARRRSQARDLLTGGDQEIA